MICFISCVKQKANAPCKAKEMYVSQLFKGAWEYANKTLKADKIFILSAKYGLLDPETVIAPYNQTLIGADDITLRKWTVTVLKQLKENGVDFSERAVFLCGKQYRKYLMPQFKNADAPLKHLGIGKQLSFYKQSEETT